MLITTKNFQQYNNVSVFYDTKTHLFVEALRLNSSNMVDLCSDFRKKVICDTSHALHRSVAIGVVLVPEIMCLLSASYLRKHELVADP